MKTLLAAVVVLPLAACQGFQTGPLTDPQVLAQRCAELNLALTVIEVASKKIDPAKLNAAHVVVDSVCSGTIVDYPSALNAVATALKNLKAK